MRNPVARWLIIASCTAGVWNGVALGQAGSGTSGLGHSQLSSLGLPMTKLFGEIKAFSSQAEVRTLDSSGVETMSVPAAFSMLDGNVRAELDLSRARSKEMTPEIAASIRQVGLDKMVSILRPDKKLTIYIYPSLRAYAEVPMSKEERVRLEKEYKLETTKLGDETIDGHACEKNKMFTTNNGQKVEALLWNARDLKSFPLQIRIDSSSSLVQNRKPAGTNEERTTLLLRFTNVQLASPDAKQFDAPAGFAKYPSVERLTQEGVMKALAK